MDSVELFERIVRASKAGNHANDTHLSYDCAPDHKGDILDLVMTHQLAQEAWKKAREMIDTEIQRHETAWRTAKPEPGMYRDVADKPKLEVVPDEPA